MQIDPLVMAALSLHAHKSVYAVLLGSGISKSAGMPTGWDVVKDLIVRIATASGEAVGDDAEAWYRSKFKKEPNYSKLVEGVAPSPPERMSLLKSYFEPSQEDKERGQKVPTPSHKAIARLVALGYIKVIVTTNFDRLMELALEAEQISPVVVSSPDQIEGMMPLAHCGCVVVKIHGDYLDTRIKNTPAELETYDKQSNALLDRIFSEYGLIVCGWSGDWDTALAGAMTRNTRHRFSTYWMARGKLSDRAQGLVKHRQAMVIPIESADETWPALVAKVEALADSRLSDPLSPRLAVATMKRYLAEDKYRIQLQDLVIRELTAILKLTGIDVMPPGSPKPLPEAYVARVERIEAACAKLIPMVAAGVYWGGKQYDGLWQRCIQPLIRIEPVAGSNYNVWNRLRHYPATLLGYSAGITAFLLGRFDLLKLLFIDTVYASDGQRKEAIYAIGSEIAIPSESGQALHPPLPKGTHWRVPGSKRLVECLRPMLSEVIGEDINFTDLFDRFEFLRSVIAAGHGRAPVGGIYCIKYFNEDPDRILSDDPALAATIKRKLLETGMFGGDEQTLRVAIERVREMMLNVHLG